MTVFSRKKTIKCGHGGGISDEPRWQVQLKVTYHHYEYINTSYQEPTLVNDSRS